MTKAPKKPDSRAKALDAMTKAELIKTIRALDRRQTQLLSKLAEPLLNSAEHVTPAPPAFPWTTE